MSWSNFESTEGRIISINMDEVVSVINYPNDQADILLKNGCMHTVTFIGSWDPEEQHNADPTDQMCDEIQDLKLENDRLKQRNDLMLSFLNAMCCVETNIKCMDCLYGKGCGCSLKSDNYEKEAFKIIKKLEALG